ncbi:MAG TPA: DUF4097 family beta strand repeat-containing protein [Chloroflexota bacterium]|jgi:hypothetical protein|nr:DUF4097 family beta strand repeat-containing protein [Chloroflexota bacterium]
MADERMRVLEMIREGKISAEEGARLLEALRSAEGRGAGGGTPAGAERGEARPDDPLRAVAGMVADILRSGDWAELGNFPWRGSWSSGPLAGLERRRSREAEGWEFLSLSDGDHGTFELPAGAQLSVESEAGGINATAGDGPARLDLEGEGLQNYAVYVARKDQQYVLSCYRTDRFARLPRLSVSVPRQVRELRLRTSGGSLHATGFSCPVFLHTAGGGINIHQQGEGPVKAHTAGGGIRVEGHPARIELHTSGGSIEFQGRTAAVDVKTSGGSIKINGARLRDGEHRARTAGGSIRFQLDRESSVQLAAQTSAGHIAVDLPGAEGQQSGSRISPRYQGRFNGTAARLDLTTSAGSINVGLAEPWQGGETAWARAGASPAPAGEAPAAADAPPSGPGTAGEAPAPHAPAAETL